MRVFSGTASQIFWSAPLTADDVDSGFLVGKLRYFPHLLTVPGCGWPWVPSTVQEAMDWKHEHSGKAPGFPGKEKIFEGRRVRSQTSGVVATT